MGTELRKPEARHLLAFSSAADRQVGQQVGEQAIPACFMFSFMLTTA